MSIVNKEQKELLWNSFVRLIPTSDQVSIAFYTRLFTLRPSLRKLFPEDMASQREKLMMMLASLIESVDNPDVFANQAAALGARHVTYGAQSEDYGVAGQALLETLQVHADLTPEERAAWTEIYRHVVEKMTP